VIRTLLAALTGLVLVAAAPSPAPSPARTLSVICVRTPFYIFAAGTNLPVRARTASPALGQRFEIVGRPRTTLEGREYYETNVLVVEPGHPPGAHYWLSSSCALPG
jgi:hypothetical protein